MTKYLTKQAILEQILEDIVIDGHYEAAFLSDAAGLPLATVESTDEVGVMMAAMTALLRDTARQVRDQLDLANVNELSLVSDDRFRFICRFFKTENGQPLNLTVIVPADQSYRRITNQAITKIKDAWLK